MIITSQFRVPVANTVDSAALPFAKAGDAVIGVQQIGGPGGLYIDRTLEFGHIIPVDGEIFITNTTISSSGDIIFQALLKREGNVFGD